MNFSNPYFCLLLALVTAYIAGQDKTAAGLIYPIIFYLLACCCYAERRRGKR